MPDLCQLRSNAPPRCDAGRDESVVRPRRAQAACRRPLGIPDGNCPGLDWSTTRGCGGIGRRARFRSVCPFGRGGSSPLIRTLKRLVLLCATALSVASLSGSSLAARAVPTTEVIVTLNAPSLLAEGRALTSARDLAYGKSLARAQSRAREEPVRGDPGRADRLPLPHRGRRLRDRRSDRRRLRPDPDPGDREGLAERPLPLAGGHPYNGLARPGGAPGTAGDRCRQALGAEPPDRGPGNQDRRDRRRHRRAAHVLQPVRVRLSGRLPEGRDEGRDHEGDRPAGLRPDEAVLQVRDAAVRPVAERLLSRDARRRDRRRRPQHPGRRDLPLRRCSRRAARELQGADDPHARLRPRRQLGADHRGDRGGRLGRDEHHQPLARRARDLAFP